MEATSCQRDPQPNADKEAHGYQAQQCAELG